MPSFIILLLAIASISACSPANPSVPTAESTREPLPADTLAPSPTSIPTSTPLSCLTQRGRVDAGALPNTTPKQEFLIYLPPCYDQQTDERYPVLYLLHGQLSQDSQWVNLGAPAAADNLIHAGQAPPFIIVFPDDRYWNLPPGDGFGDRLIYDILPYIDANFRTLADRSHRALGGLSRGGGWSIHMLLTRYDLFGSIGLHSPAMFEQDAAILERLMRAVPADAWPRLWVDAGDRDAELGKIRAFEFLLTAYEVPHEWRMYAGDHTDPYWQAHVSEYLQWYADGFASVGAQVPDPTPAP